MDVQLSALSAENSELHTVSAAEESGSASLQAPAVSQSVQNGISGRRIAQTVVEKGSIMNISVEVAPGKGRVLVQTKPLMGVVFQGAANTAVAVAANKTGADLSNRDVIFSIDSGDRIDEVDGPSAGALMTVLTIAAIEKRPVDNSLTLTGTIDENGHIGAIGGVVAKATAAKESGKTLFLIPAENQLITPPASSTAQRIFTTTRSLQQVSAQEYIEKNVGIKVAYISSIDDVIARVLKS
jgi:predicted S18 family serine protease